MRILLKNEWHKLWHSPMFWATLAVALAVAVLSAVASIRTYHAMMEAEQRYYALSGIAQNPSYEMSSVFNNWIGHDFSGMYSSLFYLLLPLFATFAYAHSFLKEQRCGYIKTILVRATRRQYFMAKYLVIALSGALVVVIPMMVNLMLVSSVLPAAAPDLQYDIYYGMPAYAMGSWLYYAHPWGFVLFRFITAVGVAALIATSTMALGFFVRNRYAAMLIPFVLLLGVDYLSVQVKNTINFSFSLMYSICGTECYFARTWVVVLWMAVLFAFSFGVTMWRGRRYEAF